MIININIDIELNSEQILFLRKFYIDKSTKQFLSRTSNDTQIADSLQDRDILKKDNLMNYTLTTIGNIIVDKIDRDKIINNILE